nr:RNA polymerase sigma factor [Cyclobacterium qasimii]
MSHAFYTSRILPYAAIISKMCRLYTNSQADFEDYYQEVCLQIWRSRDNYQGKSEWSTWVYRLSLNVCLTQLKQDQKTRKVIVTELPLNESVEDQQVYSDEDLNELYVAIKKLSEIDRTIILLYLEKKPYKEIATILDSNAKNIAVRVQRIKSRLKDLLENKIEIYK